MTCRGRNFEQESFHGNYKEVAGFYESFETTSKSKGQVTQQIVIDDILVDQPVSDSLFMMPPKKSTESQPN